MNLDAEHVLSKNTHSGATDNNFLFIAEDDIWVTDSQRPRRPKITFGVARLMITGIFPLLHNLHQVVRGATVKSSSDSKFLKFPEFSPSSLDIAHDSRVRCKPVWQRSAFVAMIVVPDVELLRSAETPRVALYLLR